MVSHTILGAEDPITFSVFGLLLLRIFKVLPPWARTVTQQPSPGALGAVTRMGRMTKGGGTFGGTCAHI